MDETIVAAIGKQFIEGAIREYQLQKALNEASQSLEQAKQRMAQLEQLRKESATVKEAKPPTE